MARDYADHTAILYFEMTDFLALNPLATLDDAYNYFEKYYKDVEIMNAWSKMFYPCEEDFDD
ncbi:hypothetical protein A2V49_00685 [candidate division WWE3 bacterium RBG_19FT_COMBO_34_6]|uniref:Uncharacterized protein n=1 Tax=candidate division WWE3 bacterium RBG_19FT_COMBO_34_6 TaxID=1802612 RepID=A0A1F4UKM0_UNCKA|nr:MAG: hypothetical protein A2V49_00685 [candidate division WWE3 bacterium RBG_19FT_COMBO_34_6]